MSKIPVILDTKYHRISISKIGAKNFGTGCRNIQINKNKFDALQ